MKKGGILAMFLVEKMEERIKLIWDFYGPNAARTADHHTKHLAEFSSAEGLKNTLYFTEEITPLHHIAILVVEKSLMNRLREILKPSRGQVYSEVQN